MINLEKSVSKDALVNALYVKRAKAFKSMTRAEADGTSDYAYWSGVVEGIDLAITVLEKWND